MPSTETENTRMRFIKAALKLFGEVGYARATTRAIAEVAGLNELTLFRHFGSKKNLLMAVTEAFNREGFAETFEAHLVGDYPADIRTMAYLQMKDAAERFEMLRLMLCEAKAIEELREIMLAGASGNLDRVAAYFGRQIEAGVVRSDIDPSIMASAFANLFSSYVMFDYMLGMNQGVGIPPEEVIDSLARIFAQGTQAAVGR